LIAIAKLQSWGRLIVQVIGESTLQTLKIAKTKSISGGCKLRNLNSKQNIMGNLLYVIAVILVVIWAISFLGGFYTGGIIHALLVIAVVVVLLRLIRSGT